MDSTRITILAIDDNPDNLITVSALLRESFPDVKVFTALSGAKGVELAAAEQPDVILLDIVMSGMDGFEVCRALKADPALHDIPVVFVTALKVDKASRIRALECGAEGFLSKPIDEIELTAVVRAMLKINLLSIIKRDEHERLAAMVKEQTRELQATHKSTLNLLQAVRSENDAWRKSEEALRASEEKFRSMVETMPLAIHLTVGDDQTSEYLNPTFLSLFGYTLTDLPTLAHWWPLAYPDEQYRAEIAAEWSRRVQRAIETKSPIEPMEVVVTCKDGSKKDISWGYVTLGEKSYSCGLT
ncbi:MAG: response regulator [Ignavibacteria bacterium]|nr:response regulator [Ignavibacteria bacterium]